LRNGEDVVRLRKAVRDRATATGFSLVDTTKIVTAASELGRNTVQYGGGGKVLIAAVADSRRKGLRLELVADPSLAHVVNMDAVRLRQVLYNLIGNALKYTAKGGSVSVNVKADGKQLLFSVNDTGIGISEDEAERIFERFYRAKDPRVEKITGTGLGLTLAREVIRLHGGDVTVESELNKGSTFTLTLPIVSEAA